MNYNHEDVVEVQGESLENAEKVFAQIQSRFEELLSNLNEITGGIDTIAEAKSVTIDSIQSISAVSGSKLDTSLNEYMNTTSIFL